MKKDAWKATDQAQKLVVLFWQFNTWFKIWIFSKYGLHIKAIELIISKNTEINK